MSVSDTLVRELHHRLTQIAEIERQIARCPRLIQSAQLQLDNAIRDLQNCKDSIKKKKMEADQKQLQQREREAKLADLGGKLNSSKNNREYQTLKEQIAADSQANSVLSDEIFEALEEIDSLQTSTLTLDSKVKLAEKEKESVSDTISKRLASLKEELARVNASLAAMEQELPSEFSGDYKRIVAVRGEDALSPLDLQSCGGCNTKVTPRVLDRLRMGHPCLCPSCGRMLYRPEE